MKISKMFTGIIEATGKVERIEKIDGNIKFTIISPFTKELDINQSIAHDGCCLSVTEIQEESYSVTAVRETLEKTNLSQWLPSTTVNLERSMQINGRLDGHIVQGHVDQTGTLLQIKDLEGSLFLVFEYDERDFTTINKGSIAVNGVSLTVCNSVKGQFSVSIIPYTWEHTNIHNLKIGDKVNLEFDIVGKYISKLIGKNL